jgi:hypothetical protein
VRAQEAKYQAEQAQAGVAREPAAAAERLIRKTAAQAAMLGTGAAAITTGAGVWTAETGLAGVLAVPAVAAAMLADLTYRAWITIEMTCDIGMLFGVRFDPDDPSDLAQLYAVALEAVSHPDNEDSRGHEMLERLIPARSEEVSASIGSMLGNETIVRNVVPVLGLLTSGVTSYRSTRNLGDASLRYVRGRRALTDAFAEVEQVASDMRDLLIEGVWFVFTADGTLDPHETAILAHFVHSRPDHMRRALLDRMHDDEAGWHERIGQIPEQARRPFMRALETAAALDTEIAEPERNVLKSASQRLGIDWSADTLDVLAGRFRDLGLRSETASQ